MLRTNPAVSGPRGFFARRVRRIVRALSCVWVDITSEQFLRDSRPQFGTANPQRTPVALWKWMVRHGGSPCPVRAKLGLPPNEGLYLGEGCAPAGAPDWCFARFGMTRAPLADLRWERTSARELYRRYQLRPSTPRRPPELSVKVFRPSGLPNELLSRAPPLVQARDLSGGRPHHIRGHLRCAEDVC